MGVFCANYYWSVAGYLPCQRMWCSECYISDPYVSFYVYRIKSEGTENERDLQDQARLKKAWGNKHRPPNAFLHARDGDRVLSTHVVCFLFGVNRGERSALNRALA
jgi:hypothetical protein